jgi:cell division protein FtsI (penicillin-binding protein 3)
MRRRKGTGSQRLRVRSVRIVLIAVLLAAGLRLVNVQFIQAEALSEKAAKQRTQQVRVPAKRGEIRDRTGAMLAFSVTTKSLSWSPKAMRARYDQAGIDFDSRTAAIAARMKAVLGDKVDERELLAKLRGSEFVYLVGDVDPAQEREITGDFPNQFVVETRARREYPGASLAATIMGYASWQGGVADGMMHGWFGLEAVKDSVLAGEPGSVTVDTQEGANGVVIPGTERDPRPAKDGADIELTLHSDVQYQAERQVADHVAGTGAVGGSVVVLDARTSEIYAIADNQSIDPDAMSTLGNQRIITTSAVTTPYQSGAVHKIVTAAAAIEHAVAGPDDSIRVPGSLPVADGVVRDEWHSGEVTMSVTGVFAKSSDVGTLALARQVGPERYAAMLGDFGLGERTNAGLPGENRGTVPGRGQWSASTLDEIAMGRGLTATLIQMTGIYQAIANDGVRVPPRIIRAVIDADGTRHEEPQPQDVDVVSQRTASTLRAMLRATVQDAPDQQSGAAPSAALRGYEIAAMSGAGTVMGIVPADNPRFVIGVALESPPGQTIQAGQLFRGIASYLTQRFSMPLKTEIAPVVPLVLSR